MGALAQRQTDYDALGATGATTENRSRPTDGDLRSTLIEVLAETGGLRASALTDAACHRLASSHKAVDYARVKSLVWRMVDERLCVWRFDDIIEAARRDDEALRNDRTIPT